VTLSDGVGVLVGRNGAGKSAILEGFEAISLYAIGRKLNGLQRSSGIPTILQVEILTPENRQLNYRYELVAIKPLEDLINESDIDDANDSDIDDVISNGSDEMYFSWHDHCQYIDRDKEVLWTTELGGTTYSTGDGGQEFTVLGEVSSLRHSHLPKYLRQPIPIEMQWLHAVLKGVRLLGKGSLRQTSKRQPCILQISSKGLPYSTLPGAIGRLSCKIFRLMQTEESEEFQSVCRRIGLADKIDIKKFRDTKNAFENEDDYYLSSIFLDGVDLGFLSDGTLRVLSIIIEIITSQPSITTMIEEPETQIHPGLLAKLLSEIDSYTFEENLLLSTQSPQVVTWAKPQAINLVHRDKGITTVRKLKEEEIKQVGEYLFEEGGLGDWIYSGIIDE